MELDYLTWQALDRNKDGSAQSIETYEVDDDTFKSDIEQMNAIPDDWEDVTNGTT